MEITNLNKNCISEFEQSIIGLGNFDGMHAGHIELIKRVIENAKISNLKSSLLLFKEHTDLLLSSNKTHLTSIDDKIEILKNYDLSNIFLINFDEYIRSMSPGNFLNEILLKKCNSKAIVVGKDYKFGYKASGDVDFLNKEKNNKYHLYIIDDYKYNGKRISSSNIKDLILKGDISSANILLTRNYKIKGKVISGDGRGRKLGFPTANLDLDFNYVIPCDGVYFTITKLKDFKYPSLTSIGYNPTFSGKQRRIEIFINDFSKDIYNKSIELEFVEYLRPTIHYDSADDLIKQIKTDKKKMLKLKDVYMK